MTKQANDFSWKTHWKKAGLLISLSAFAIISLYPVLYLGRKLNQMELLYIIPSCFAAGFLIAYGIKTFKTRES